MTEKPQSPQLHSLQLQAILKRYKQCQYEQQCDYINESSGFMTANCLSELTEDGVETKERAEIKPFSVTHQSP